MINIKEYLKKLGVNVEGLNVGEISDGYHTFNELYEHRCLLFLHLAMTTKALCVQHDVEECNPFWCSKLHHDGTGFEGWFIMGCKMGGFPITYHLPDKYWIAAIKLCKTLEKAPEWDGHTSNDVIQRMLNELPL